MARIITSGDLLTGNLRSQDRHYIYNGLDCCVTSEIHGVLKPRLLPEQERIYKFELGLQRAAMTMMLRGVRVDTGRIKDAIQTLEADKASSVSLCNTLAEGWDGLEKNTGKCPEGGRHAWPRGEPDETRKCSKCGAPRMQRAEFNPMSDDQCKHLFYDLWKLTPQTNKTGKVSVDKECLDKIAKRYVRAEPLVKAIKQARDIGKQIGVLNSGVSADGRMRSTFNIGAAWTGRLSSNKNPYDEGTNLQNIAEKLRYIFIADPLMELFYADLEQAESCCVAHLAGDENYIEAHKQGDVHTYVSRLLWPELPWTGELAKDKKIAEDTHPTWDPDHSFRYNAKRIQHGSNYLLSPFGIARIAHIPRAAAEEAQDNYFRAFPNIRQWHHVTVAQVRQGLPLTSPLGRRIQFFGRPWDAHTHKQAVASMPQSMVADLLDTAMAHVAMKLDPKEAQLLAQVHDALLGQTLKGDRVALRKVLDCMTIPTKIMGIDGRERTMVIGTDVMVGQNWSKASDQNPLGMRKVKF